MHPSVLEFVAANVTAGMVAGRRVLEIGSYDVNGSVRPLIEALGPAEYVGVDVVDGPGVDVVADCERLRVAVGDDWDFVISTEMLEHVDDWRCCIAEMVDALAAGGTLVVTTRSPGFPFHPFPKDNWRFTRDCMVQIVDILGLTVGRIDNDWQCPGVFVMAHKSSAAVRGVLDAIEAERMYVHG